MSDLAVTRLRSAVWRYALVALLALSSFDSISGAEKARLPFLHRSLELDGLPVAVLTPDLDRDGVRDLAVVVAGARWGELGFSDPVEVDASGVFADALTVVPALFDRRGVALFRGGPDGFAEEAKRLDLPVDVRVIDQAGGAAPLVAWTDDGVSEVVLGADGELALEPRFDARSLLAGSVDLLAPLGLAVDLDGDGRSDLLVPTAAGIEIHLASASGFESKPSQTIPVPLEELLPGDARHYAAGAVRRTPLPVARDLDGDRLPELLFHSFERGWNELRVLKNLGHGRFGPPVDPLNGRARDAKPELVFVGDLDGKPGAELLTAEPLDKEEGSMREEMRAAKRPRVRYQLHTLDTELHMKPEPLRQFELVGHLFGGEGIEKVSPVRDLDGDGRVDLVPLRLDFSLFEAARAIAAKRIKVGLEFGVECQSASGDFKETATLTGELRLKLDAARLGQVNSLDGDFDGDGRADYLRLGPGAKAEIYLGRAGCQYPKQADATLELAAEPGDASLVLVEDFDGDGKSDLGLIRPRQGGDEADLAATLELYLSKGAR